MHDSNPYAPPRARPEPGPRRLTPLTTFSRAAAVVAGFSLLAGPSRPAPDVAQHRGQMAAKVLGATLLLAAFFPIGWLGMGKVEPEGPPEAL